MGLEKDIFCNNFEVWKKDKKILFENQHVYSILSITPTVPALTLVIPKKHIENFSELTGNIAEEFFHAIPKTFEIIQEIYESCDKLRDLYEFYTQLSKTGPFDLAKLQAKEMLIHPELKVKPVAYNVGINYGTFAGQTVNHLHWQLIPRRENKDRPFGIATAFKEYLN